MSYLEATLSLFIRDENSGLPEPVTEHRFHPKRRWRFDFAWPDFMLAVEVEGGVWNGGRHTRGKGFTNDCEKYNEATLMGWRVLRFTGSQVNDGTAIKTIQRAFKGDNCVHNS